MCCTQLYLSLPQYQLSKCGDLGSLLCALVKRSGSLSRSGIYCCGLYHCKTVPGLLHQEARKDHEHADNASCSACEECGGVFGEGCGEGRAVGLLGSAESALPYCHEGALHGGAC
eukprot:3757650-Rhodomonas_salina.1